MNFANGENMSTNNNNNYSTQKNVTTKLRTFYSKLSCLQVTFWNKSISLRVNPVLGVNADGIRQYDFSKRISTALAEDKCISLVNEIDKYLIPAIEKYNETGEITDVSIGVSVGDRGSKIFFEYKPSEDGVPSVFLTIYTSVDQENKTAAENIFKYEFQKVPVEEEYDSETGTSKIVYVEAEFLYIYEKMKNIGAISPSVSHGIAVNKAHSTVRDGNNQANNQNNQNMYNNRNGNIQQPQMQQSIPVPSQYTNNMITGEDGLPF